MFALLSVPLIILLLFLVLLLLSQKHYKYALLLFLSTILISCFTESIPVNIIRVEKKENSKCLRVMSYNVDAKYGHYKNLQNWKDIVQFIDSINPDIILPQEFDFYGGEKLRMALNARYPYNCRKNFGIGYYGTEMIFSRYPVLSYEYLLRFPTPVYKLVINVKGKKVNVINNYLHSNNFTSEIESGKHNFQQKLKEGYLERAKEVGAIVDSLKSCTNVPLIVCGDMNDVSGSYTIHTLQNSLNLKDAWWQGGTGFGFTYHGYGVMRFRLDHILYNKYLELQSVSVPHVGFSDHWPIVADFIIK